MYQSVRERLLSIGARAANLLAAYDDLYQSFERMKGLFFDELPFSIQFVRIYVMDEESQGMREEVCYFYDSIQQGHDFIPLYQLPAQLIREKRITPAHGGYNPSKLIPLHVSGSLVGMLEIGTNEAFDEELTIGLEQMASLIALGLKHSLLKESVKLSEELVDGIIKIGSTLHYIHDMDRMVRMFALSVMEFLPFDRVTVFIFDPTGEKVAHNLCINARREEFILENIPKIPLDLSSPLPFNHSTGFWLPLKSNTRNVGAVLVDNLYTSYPISGRIIDLLLLVCDQLASEVENIRLFADLQRAAQYDELTGVYNRRMGIKILEEWMAKSNIDKTPLTVCFLDVNDLKRINDTYGHDEGDKLIKAAMESIKECLQDQDTICRLGGDEFLVIFPGRRLYEAEAVWNEVCAHIRRTNRIHSLPYIINISHGMAEYDPEEPVSPTQLISIADKKMYREKRSMKGTAPLFFRGKG